MRPNQLSFLPRVSLEHGGSLRLGKRKTMRPIDSKRLIHVVLRSSRARGEWSMLHTRHRGHIDRTVERVSGRYGVRLYRYANVGNHLHLLVKFKSRPTFQGFLRELAGAVASIVTGAKKSNPMGRFWDHLAYTRIVGWGRDFKNLELYFVKNLFEAAGLLTRRAKALGFRVIPILGWSGPP